PAPPIPTHFSREFGFILEGRPVLIDDVRVRGVGRTPRAPRPPVAAAEAGEGGPEPADHVMCYWAGRGRVRTPVHMLAELKAGHSIEGE
ncbi:unnamed protein product, partial [Discosporangium mesarthrocarpum]